MADLYAKQQQGVADGTLIPAGKADGREVNAARSVIIASKPTDVAIDVSEGDRMFLGYRPANTVLVDVKLCIGTSLGATAIDIGDGTTVDKYVDGATLTTVDRPTSIGPKASTMDDGPLAVREEIWATFLTADVAAAVALTFVLEFSSLS